jgi:hypothetical protein
MRLYDRVMRGEWILPIVAVARDMMDDDDLQRTRTRITDELAAAVPIVADNVIEHYYAGTDQEEWDIFTDFPCLAPPFPKFWIEGRRPSRIVSRVHGMTPSAGLPPVWGMYFTAQDMEESGREGWANIQQDEQSRAMAKTEMRRVIEMMWESADVRAELAQADAIRQASGEAPALSREAQELIGLTQAYLRVESGGPTEEEYAAGRGHLMLDGTLFVQEGAQVLGLCLRVSLILKADGSPEMRPFPSVIKTTFGDEFDHRLGLQLQELGWPLYLAICFMHCKNVTLTEQEGQYPSRQVRREAERRGDPPLTKFYTLNIEPMKKVLRDEGGSETVGLKRALHICRGHFSHYSEDKPLFGKYAGQFWIPAHVRGTAEAGMIAKDYNVKPPAKDVA